MPLCTNISQFRSDKTVPKYPRTYDYLYTNYGNYEPKDITKRTGCRCLKFIMMPSARKPCRYRSYSIVGPGRKTNFNASFPVFSIYSVSNDTRVEAEELIYPLSSLVAEFGGTLGLFLGFSFITLWDGAGRFWQILSQLTRGKP